MYGGRTFIPPWSEIVIRDGRFCAKLLPEECPSSEWALAELLLPV